MKHNQVREPKDRDFLRTRERMFFCVTGYLHPPDRYTAYLKYSPVDEGKWEDGQTAYRRELPYYHVDNVANTVRYLEERYPRYVYDCPVRHIRFSMVPKDHVARYYVPEERLQEILRDPQDSVEEQVRGLALSFAAAAAIDPAELGITGSVLIGLHDPDFSDIDVTVYGLGNARRLRQALHSGSVPGIRPLDDAFVAEWSTKVAERFPLTTGEAQYLAGRRWNYGTYQGRYFSVHPTRSDDEIPEVYGEHIYRSRGRGCIRATISDASEALFMPAIYRVADVRVLDGGPDASQVREVVSYEGLFRDVAEAGATVEARGKIEAVDGQPRRLVIGTTESRGTGYIKPV